MDKLDIQSDEAIEKAGYRGQAMIMLDPLERGGGGSGGAREGSAWILLACYASSYATVITACEGAIAKGVSATHLASSAIVSDAPLALRWCLEQGGLTSRTSLLGYGSSKELGQIAIDSEARKCVDMLDAWEGAMDVPGEGELREDGLMYAARRLKLGPLQCLLERRKPSKQVTQRAMDVLVPVIGRHWSSGESNPALLVKALMPYGARLGCTLPYGVESPIHAHRIAEKFFIARPRYAPHGSGGSDSGQRALSDTLDLIASESGWTSWTGGLDTPNLGLHCLSQPGLTMAALASVFKDDAELRRCSGSLLALTMGAQRRTVQKVSDACALLSHAVAMGCAKPTTSELAHVLAQAMPSHTSKIMEGYAKDWMNFYTAVEPICTDSGLKSLVLKAHERYEEVSQKGLTVSINAWASWEAIALGFSSFTAMPAVNKATLRL